MYGDLEIMRMVRNVEHDLRVNDRNLRARAMLAAQAPEPRPRRLRTWLRFLARRPHPAAEQTPASEPVRCPGPLETVGGD